MSRDLTFIQKNIQLTKHLSETHPSVKVRERFNILASGAKDEHKIPVKVSEKDPAP